MSQTFNVFFLSGEDNDFLCGGFAQFSFPINMIIKQTLKKRRKWKGNFERYLFVRYSYGYIVTSIDLFS